MTEESSRDVESGRGQASPQGGVEEQAPVAAADEGGAGPFSGTYFGLRRRQYQNQFRTMGGTSPGYRFV